MIVPMSKICVVGLTQDRPQILKKISTFGAIEIIQKSAEYNDELNDALQTELSTIRKMLGRTKKAISVLKIYDKEKKPLFSEKISVSQEEMFSQSDEIYATVKEITRNFEELEFQKAQLPKFEIEKAKLEPYIEWNIKLDKKSTKNVIFEIGFFDKGFAETEFLAEIQKLFVTPYKLSNNKDGVYYGFVVGKNSSEEFYEVTKKYGFTKASDSNFDKTPKKQIDIFNIRTNNTQKKILHYEDAIKRFSIKKEDILKYHDALSSREELKVAQEKIINTKSAFIIDGYIPTNVSENISKILNDDFSVAVFITDVEQGEEFPIKLENPSVIQPFEVVTEMYSMPLSGGIDPSKIMAPFYFIFFGMMLSDAGYGILLTLATGFILWKMKPTGQFKKLSGLLCICGISTTIFGLIFGSFFSDLISTITLGKVVQPALINPMEDPMSVLLLGYVFGVIHILVGLGLKGYILIRDGKPWDAIFDIGSWYLVFAGIALFFFPQTKSYATYVIIAGVAMLILTQGRTEKNIFKKLTSGILSLYDATGFLSDILSYSRLLALGLSTAVVGMVINKMGSMGATQGWNFIAVIVFILVFLLGHSFNIAINVLGSYVHTCRLMYIEFFGKFFEGGGRAFKPLAIKLKYTKAKEQN